MFKMLNAWLESFITVLAADANIPENGRRVVFPGLPMPYFLVDEVTKTTDPRGKKGWIARVRGRDGNTRTLNSDDPKCATFSHYNGKPYDWDKEESERNEQQRVQNQQKDLVKAFEAEFRFKDGRPLRAYDNKKLMVTVGPTAIGNLETFRDEKLYVDKINYPAKTVDLSLVGAGMEDLASALLGVPASDVVSGTNPTIAENILVQPVEIVNPRFNRNLPVTPENRPFLDRDMGELMNMTPLLNRLAENGQVTLSARIFPHYQSRGMSGMEQYQRDLELYGAEMDEIPYSQQLNVETWKPRGAFTGTVIIHPPFDEKELRAELQVIAPGYKIKSGGGSLKVDNVYLFRAMMALGARGPERADANWLRPRGVPETPSQRQPAEGPPLP